MDNKFANVILYLGAIQIMVGIFLGLILGYDYNMDWGIMFTWIGIGTVSGIFTIGFAQIIELLHKINMKLGGSDMENTNTKDALLAIDSIRERADDGKFKL